MRECEATDWNGLWGAFSEHPASEGPESSHEWLCELTTVASWGQSRISRICASVCVCVRGLVNYILVWVFSLCSFYVGATVSMLTQGFLSDDIDTCVFIHTHTLSSTQTSRGLFLIQLGIFESDFFLILSTGNRHLIPPTFHMGTETCVSVCVCVCHNVWNSQRQRPSGSDLTPKTRFIIQSLIH